MIITTAVLNLLFWISIGFCLDFDTLLSKDLRLNDSNYFTSCGKPHI